MNSGINNHLLASQIKVGNHLAFGAIYDQCHKELYYIAYRYLKSRELAEDAVQQAFINLWINRHRIDEKMNLRGYLFTTLKNHTINVIAEEKKTVEKNYKLLIESTISEADDEDPDQKIEMTEAIYAIVEELSPQKRKIFQLKIEEGLSNKQISEELGISVNTVKVHYYQIMNELRSGLSKKMLSAGLLIYFLFSR